MEKESRMSMSNSNVELYTDGACSGNPGPGGWGYVIVSSDIEYTGSGFEELTTNNRMELLAIIKGLDSLDGSFKVLITTDSKYVVDSFTKGWLEKWKANGWKTSSKQSVKNQDLWEDLDKAVSCHEVSWQWVKGHSGHAMNEKCDELARKAINERR